MTTLNIWAYYDPDFGSTNAPYCEDGNTGDDTVRLRPGEVRWDRTVPFNDLDHLVHQLDPIVTRGREGAESVRIGILGILCHGLPGRLRLLPDGHILHASNLSSYTDRLRALHAILARGGGRRSWPVLMFMSCSAAAPPRGDGLFAPLSSWFSGTRVIGFATLLTTDATRPRDLEEGRICLPPDVRVTDRRPESESDIRRPGGTWSADDAAGFPHVGPRASYAREFREGALYWEAPEMRSFTGATGLFRPTETYQGRGRGGPPSLFS